MKSWKAWMTLLCFPLAYAALQGTAKAGEWNQATMFRFSEPVEVPGRVLPAGSYVFKLMSSASNRNIVEIFNRNQTRLYATVLAIPDYRMQPTGKPVITLEERPADSPEAIHAWFYPGSYYGHEFVYSRTPSREMAEASGRQASADPAGLAADAVKAAKSAAGLVASGARDTLHFLAKEFA
jgi:hypothetical protein